MIVSTTTWKAANKIAKYAGKKTVVFTVDSMLVENWNEEEPKGIILTDNTPSEFIEWDVHHDPQAMYIFIWTNTHPQYNWIKEKTNVPHSNGVFEIHPEKMSFYGSVKPFLACFNS